MSISYTPTTWIDNDTLVDADKLNNIETGVQAACDAVDGLATVATSGSYDDLSDTPSLATVATSGSYDDLSDTPTIGDATLTIQKNSTSVGTFTANATSDVTINLSVPTSVSELTDDVGLITNPMSTDLVVNGITIGEDGSGNYISVNDTTDDLRIIAGTEGSATGDMTIEASNITLSVNTDDGGTATYNGSEIATKSDFAITWETLASSISISPSADYTLTYTPTKSGYTAVGILGYSLTGSYNTYLLTSRIYIDSGVIYWIVHNSYTGSTSASITFKCAVLWQAD